LVCPGIYPEQVTISKNLTVNGIQNGNSGQAVIVPPAAGLVQNATGYNVPSGFLQNAALAAQIIVSAGVTVNFNDLTLDATNNNLANCGPIPVGIYFGDSSGSVNHLSFRNQLSTCFFNGFAGLMSYPWGDGVFVQSDGALPANVTIQNSSFHNPGWMGAHGDGAGVTVSVKGNTVLGPGTTYGNGILVEFGAAASYVSSNSETNALLNGQPTGFWGILLNSCAGNSVVNSNTVSDSNAGIVAECNGNNINGNKVFASGGDGIQVCGSNNTVQNNIVNDSGGAGVNLVQGCASTNNVVTGNSIDGACTAILQGTDAVGNTVSPNLLFNTKFLLLSGSSCS
jgi:parallel beta-helix repeat protein